MDIPNRPIFSLRIVPYFARQALVSIPATGCLLPLASNDVNGLKETFTTYLRCSGRGTLIPVMAIVLLTIAINPIVACSLEP